MSGDQRACSIETPGTLVWAKLGSNPWWPAEVEKLIGKNRVRVLFFGDQPSNGDVLKKAEGVVKMTSDRFSSFATVNNNCEEAFLYAVAQAVTQSRPRPPATFAGLPVLS
jgi:hypothetical protein